MRKRSLVKKDKEFCVSFRPETDILKTGDTIRYVRRVGRYSLSLIKRLYRRMISQKRFIRRSNIFRRTFSVMKLHMQWRTIQLNQRFLYLIAAIN